MRKPNLISVMLVLTLLFGSFALGFLLGRNQSSDVIISVPHTMLTAPTQPPETEAIPETTEAVVVFPININTADRDTLTALPGIGYELARRIVEFRQEHGSFTAVEELMLVDGIGEKRLEQMLDLITIGG